MCKMWAYSKAEVKRLMQSQTELLDKMKTITEEDGNCSSNYAMIDCRIDLTKFGTLTKFRRFSCWSYYESHGGMSGIINDKHLGTMFHFTAHSNFIMIYPVKYKSYKPESFVDYFKQIKKSIDKNAELMTYEEFQKRHKDDQP